MRGAWLSLRIYNTNNNTVSAVLKKSHRLTNREGHNPCDIFFAKASTAHFL